MPGRWSSQPYDVIIAGASFAGLAAAQRLQGRVLLLDRQPIGEGVTSACAAPVRIVRLMGAEAAIQQEHRTLVIHAHSRRVAWALPEPFCTFDYRVFCLEAAARARAEFRRASVLGRDGSTVFTSAGAFAGRFLVDATGPRAALAGPGRPRYVAFGIESEVPVGVEPGLHFHFVPEIPDGYAWAFPCGGTTRFGILSYRGRTKLLPALGRFMTRFGAAPGGLHGGHLVTGWTPGVVDGVFAVGDAAGHCLPLSGEGIRTAALTGARCGELIQQALDGRISPAEAAAAYRAHVAADRGRYRALLWATFVLLWLPRWCVGSAAAMMARPGVLRWFFDGYLAMGSGVAG